MLKSICTDNIYTSNVLWRSLYADVMTEEEKNLFVKSHCMPDKGYGTIQVSESDVEKAISILKEQVGDFEFEYYPKGLISSDMDSSFYYGKFDIEDLHGYLSKLIENKVTIINVYLHKEEY